MELPLWVPAPIRNLWRWAGVADSIWGRLLVLGGSFTLVAAGLFAVWAALMRSFGVGGTLVFSTAFVLAGTGTLFVIAGLRSRPSDASEAASRVEVDPTFRIEWGEPYASYLNATFWVRIPMKYFGAPSSIRGVAHHLSPPHDTRSGWDTCWKEHEGRDLPVVNGEGRFINLLRIHPTNPDSPTLTMFQLRPDRKASPTVRIQAQQSQHQIGLNVIDSSTGNKESCVITLGFEPGHREPFVRLSRPAGPQAPEVTSSGPQPLPQ